MSFAIFWIHLYQKLVILFEIQIQLVSNIQISNPTFYMDFTRLLAFENTWVLKFRRTCPNILDCFVRVGKN